MVDLIKFVKNAYFSEFGSIFLGLFTLLHKYTRLETFFPKIRP